LTTTLAVWTAHFCVHSVARSCNMIFGSSQHQCNIPIITIPQNIWLHMLETACIKSLQLTCKQSHPKKFISVSMIFFSFFFKLIIWNIDNHTCRLDSTFLCPHLLIYVKYLTVGWLNILFHKQNLRAKYDALWERSHVDNSFHYICIYCFSYLLTYYY
jgi:hypothetical protein